MDLSANDQCQVEVALASMATKGYPSTMLTALVAASTVVAALWSPENSRTLVIWFVTMVASLLIRLIFARRALPPPHKLSTWKIKWAAGAAASGCVWGSLPYLFLSPQTVDSQVLVYLTFVSTGVTGAVSVLHVASFAAAASFQCTFLLPLILRLFTLDGELHTLEAITALAYLIAILVGSLRIHRQLRQTQVAEQLRSKAAALQQQQEWSFRSLTDNLPDNIARWDCEGRYLYVNPTHEITLGKPAEQVLGTFLPSSHDQVWSAIRQVVATGESISGQRQAVTNAAGDVSIHEVSVIPERNERGQLVSVLGLGRDITAKVRIHDALSASERQFRTLAENIPSFLARYTPDGRGIYRNTRLDQFLGFPQRDVDGFSARGMWPEGQYALYQASIHEVAGTGENQEIELTVQDALGKPAVHHMHFIAERDNAGDVVSVLVIGNDVTEQKRADAEIRMAANVFESSNEGIIITDLTGRVVKANPACTRITGYENAELLGMPAFLIDSSLHGESFVSAISNSLQTQGTWTGEIESRFRNGQQFPMRMSISAVYAASGETSQYVGIFSDISQLKRHEAELEYIAHHDTLTSLPNRVLLIDRLQQAMAQVRLADKILAVLFIDLDGFKPINDRLGHQVGDQTLVEMGKRMTDSLRTSDTVARIGGDEFVVLLPGLSNADECEHLTRRILKEIAEPIDVKGHSFSLSASIGIALYPNDADDADSLLRYADEAMYTAKRTGRNQYVFCETVPRQGFHFNSSVHDLRIALDQDQIEVHYQPIVDLTTGCVTKAEALVRWRHPERGLVSPAEFIPIAEETGLIHAIGTRVFSKAVGVAQAWNSQCKGGELRRISVNRSPREFLDVDGVDSWMALLDGQCSNIGHMLVVEITEGLLLDDRPKVLDQLTQLRSVGMSIALDDFGTGFSSLAYLKKFAIDYLKIDRSFVLDIETDPSDRVIVESVIAMARHLGIQLIAEGVETNAQASLLSAAHCDYAQGYLYARPMPEAEFLDFVAQADKAPLAVPRLKWTKPPVLA